MTKKEYEQFAATGSLEPARRKSMDYAKTVFNKPAEGVKGYHLCKHGEDQKTTKPKLRIAIIPKNGNPRLSKVIKPEQLDAIYAR